MISVRGIYLNKAVRLLQPVTARDGQEVIIVFLDKPDAPSAAIEDTDWDAFERLTEAHVVRTGITDLAHQHDHYLYGKTKIE